MTRNSLLFKECKKYLSYAFKNNESEKKLILEFEKWLPSDIIDIHTHNNLQSQINGISDWAYSHMISTFPSFSISESLKLNKKFHPTKNIQSLRFSNVYKGLDNYKVNEYLIKSCPKNDKIALFGLPDDIEYTINQLRSKRFVALKMYYSYIEPPANTIYEIFKPDILKVAQELSIPIILHLPKQITDSVNDVMKLANDYPKLKIIIAHLGSSKFVLPDLETVFLKIASKPNIYLDTALNPSPEVCCLALKVFGTKRIMYGSDSPFNLIRSVPYIHPKKGQQIITEYLYHWLNKDDYKKYKIIAAGACHSHWMALLALKSAIEKLTPSKQEIAKKRIFYENAKELFNFK